jgi:PAS domain S-box-containing protein
MRLAWHAYYTRLIHSDYGDEDQKTRGEILRILLLINFAFLLLLTGINLGQALLDRSQLSLSFVFWDFIAFAVISVTWIVSRRSQVRFASYFFLILTLGGCLFSFPFQDLEKVLILFAIPILASSFLISPASSYVFAFLVAAGYTILYFVNHSGADYNYISVPVFFILAIFSQVISTRLQQSLAASQQRERHYKSMFEFNRAVQLLIDPDTATILDANQAACELYGYPQEVIKTMRVPDLDGKPYSEVQERLSQMKAGQITHYTSTAKTSRGETYDIEIYPSPLQIKGKTAVYLIIHDITERKKAENLARSHAQRIELLFEASQIFSSTLDLHVIYTAIHQFVARTIPCDSLFVSAYDPQDRLIRGSYAWVDQTEIDANQLPPIPLEEEGRGVQSRVIRSGNSLLLPDYELYMLTADSHYYVEEDGKTRTELEPDEDRPRSGILTPLKMSGNVVGVIQVMSNKLADYTEDNLHFLETLAVNASFAITNARLYAELHERFEERSLQLDDANRELDAITHSLSADVQAPVRAISGFTQILKENYATHLPEEAQRYLDLIQSNIVQMNQLTEGLMALSRMERHSLNIQPVSSRAIVDQVLGELRPGLQGRRVKITIADLPVTMADPLMLRQVYLNLLSNAFKFTRGREEANIEIGYLVRSSPNANARPGFGGETGEKVFFVRDNGIGFDTHYADQLFGVFQRLHSSQKFEGTGIGLAIVHRIIKRHGGRLWAESEVDHGATFYFTMGSEKIGT